MIDWDYEQRLVDRIAARELIADLAPRQRRILSRRIRYGDTQREIAAREQISTPLVCRTIDDAISLLAERYRRGYAKRPLRTLPPGFDRAEFLRHMQGLIARREGVAREMFARERAELDRIIGDADKPPKPKPPKSPPVKQWQLYPHHLVAQAAAFHAKDNVEPWFDPNRIPDAEGLKQITLYAVNYFAAALRVPSPGLATPKQTTLHVGCRRDADAIAGVLYPLALQHPAHDMRRFAGMAVKVSDTQHVSIDIGFE